MSSSKSNVKLSTIIQRARSLGFLVFATTLTVYLLTLNGKIATDHPTAFLDFAYAVWAHHSLALGPVLSYHPNSVDIFIFKGYYYMSAAPGTAILALPFAALGFTIERGFTVFRSVMVLSEVPVALTNALAAFFLFKTVRLYFDERLSAFLAFAYAFATLSWPFATMLFQHDPAALFNIMSAYLTIQIGRGFLKSGRGTLVCGLSLSLAFLLDYVNILIVPIVLTFLLISLRREAFKDLKLPAGMAAGLAFGAGSFLLYNYASFGNPLSTSEQLYLQSSFILNNFNYPLHLGLILNTITPLRSVFLFAPMLLIGVYGVPTMARHYRREVLFLLSLFLALFITYSAWYAPDGGWSYGPRFVLPSIPFLLVPAGFGIHKMSRNGHTGRVFFVYTIGAIINALGALTTATAPILPNQPWLSTPILDTAWPRFWYQDLDSWWLNLGNAYLIRLAAGVTAISILAFVFYVPGYLLMPERFDFTKYLKLPTSIRTHLTSRQHRG